MSFTGERREPVPVALGQTEEPVDQRRTQGDQNGVQVGPASPADHDDGTGRAAAKQQLPPIRSVQLFQSPICPSSQLLSFNQRLTLRAYKT